MSEKDVSGGNLRSRWLGLGAFVVVVSLAFVKPLLDLARYALTHDLYSHVVLVPFVSLYLIWRRRKEQPRSVAASPLLGLLALLIGLLTLGVGLWMIHGQGWQPSRNDYLALFIFAYVAVILSGCWAFLGQEIVRANLFAFGFLFLMIPLPTFLVDGINGLLQWASAEASYAFLRWSGTPVFRQGMAFHLPGIIIQVAEECSGIHSTLILFISSLVAGRYFLKTPWKRAVLILAIIPIGIVRNGLRIFMLAVLSVRLGPEMIQSPLHTHGGQPFFALSLAILFALLLLLRKSEGLKASQLNKV